MKILLNIYDDFRPSVVGVRRPSPVVVVRRPFRRRRRPLSCPPSVRRPSRRRRPLSVRPVRPSRPSHRPSRPVRPVPSVPSSVPSVPSVVVKLQIQGRVQLFAKKSKYESYNHGTIKIRIYAKNAADSLGRI